MPAMRSLSPLEWPKIHGREPDHAGAVGGDFGEPGWGDVGQHALGGGRTVGGRGVVRAEVARDPGVVLEDVGLHRGGVGSEELSIGIGGDGAAAEGDRDDDVVLELAGP